MLPRRYRADRSLLTELFSTEGRLRYRPRRLRAQFFDLSVYAYPTLKPKIAFVVSAKTAAQAVDRNRIKRRARAILYPRCARLPANQVFIFTFNKKASGALFKELESDILILLPPPPATASP